MFLPAVHEGLPLLHILAHACSVYQACWWRRRVFPGHQQAEVFSHDRPLPPTEPVPTGPPIQTGAALQGVRAVGPVPCLPQRSAEAHRASR
jgi:hypothetical protein